MQLMLQMFAMSTGVRSTSKKLIYDTYDTNGRNVKQTTRIHRTTESRYAYGLLFRVVDFSSPGVR